MWFGLKKLAMSCRDAACDWASHIPRIVHHQIPDAMVISPAYGDLIATSLRQMTGTIEITTSTQAAGSGTRQMCRSS